MTYKEIKAMIESIGLPYSYHQVPDTSQAPPYVCFFYDASDDFLADDKNYQEITELTITLYTREKDIELEATVKEILTTNGLVYTWTGSYADSEKLHATEFTTEVLITEGKNE